MVPENLRSQWQRVRMSLAYDKQALNWDPLYRVSIMTCILFHKQWSFSDKRARVVLLLRRSWRLESENAPMSRLPSVVSRSLLGKRKNSQEAIDECGFVLQLQMRYVQERRRFHSTT